MLIASTSVSELVVLLSNWWMVRMLIQKKRQALLALFLCLSFDSYGQCLAQGVLQAAQVKRVIDGDTLHLVDGRKVRT